jgi:hypothetical protein
MPGMFLGEEYEFWLALKERADRLDATNLIREIAVLRSKVSFYESRIKAMSTFMNNSQDCGW